MGSAARKAVTSIDLTGNDLIDGVLSGVKWSGSSLTYAFPTSSSNYSYSGEKNHQFAAISAKQQVVAQFTLDKDYGNAANDGFSVEGFTNLSISKGSVTGADVRFAESSTPDTAYAYYPETGSRGGDVWFGKSGGYRDAVAGNYAYHTMMHEIGHALGLKHGHEAEDGFPTLPANKNSMEYSIMTYDTYIGDDGGAVAYDDFSAPQTFMMADIAALQVLYGADFTTNSGNTVYSWSPTSGKTLVNGVTAISPGANTIFATIWDGGGTDTYDLSKYTNDLDIDLAPGGYSTFKTSQLADLGGGPNNGHARGNIFNALQYHGDSRSLIENAIGGSGDDTIFGNAAKNVLKGGAGSDLIAGLDRNDTLYGGSGADYFYFGEFYDKDTVRDFQDGTDLIYIGFGITRKADVLALKEQDGNDVIFDFGDGDVLRIKDELASHINSYDIVLAPHGMIA